MVIDPPAPSEGRPVPHHTPAVVERKRALILGRFEVVRVLGEGGYGTVYLALDRGVQVAVKVPHAPKDPVDQLRFVREAYALAAVHDPHVVALREIGVAAGQHFYTMEYVPGATLFQRVDRHGTIGETAARAILRGLLRAMRALHAARLVHRDVKPSNVVLRGGLVGEPVLVDFGLARLETDIGLTAPDVFLGTPQFLAPETVRDDVRDHRSDLFATGATVRWALTGLTGLEGLRGLPLLDAVARGPDPLPAGAVSPPFARLLDDLCSADPARRPQSAVEALEALEG